MTHSHARPTNCSFSFGATCEMTDPCCVTYLYVHIIWKIPLKMLQPRNPPNRETDDQLWWWITDDILVSSAKRALYSIQRAPDSIKRALYSIKRALYSFIKRYNVRCKWWCVTEISSMMNHWWFFSIFYQKSPIFHQKSLIFYHKSPRFFQKSPIYSIKR